MHWKRLSNVALLQVDLNLPGRLGATYVDKDGIKKNTSNVSQSFI